MFKNVFGTTVKKYGLNLIGTMFNTIFDNIVFLCENR